MLERAAATLEPCSSLQRILPSARQYLQTRRQLHTTFWQHGAYDFELLDACQALLRTPRSEPFPAQPPSRTKESAVPMMASVFLLDFLYPRGAVAMLRKMYPAFPKRLEPIAKVHQPFSRLFMSSFQDRSAGSRSSHVSARGPPNQTQTQDLYEGDGMVESQAPGSEDNTVKGFNLEDYRHLPVVERLEIFIDNKTFRGNYERIWENFGELSADVQTHFRRKVIHALATSARPLEAWRVQELFAFYDVEEWTEDIVLAQIRADLVTGNLSSALSVFRAALKLHGHSQPLDLLIAYGISANNWDLITVAWKTYLEIRPDEFDVPVAWLSMPPEPAMSGKVKINRSGEFSTDLLTETSTSKQNSDSPDATKPASGKWNYVVAPEVEYTQVSAISDLSLRIRTHFAKLPRGQFKASKEKWPLRGLFRHIARNSLNLFRPADAELIMEHASDPVSYAPYIVHLSEQGRLKEAEQQYMKYRSLSDPRPRAAVLHAIVPAYYPDHVQGMERLREDWYRGYPHPDEAAYKKFLTYYAKRGDLASFMNMTKEYEEHYDANIRKDPMYVRTLMHAHAVRGDPQSVRQVMEDAAATVGHEPGRMEQNILLKAYYHEGDYDAALDLFSRMWEMDNVDQYALTTVMKNAGWRGDLSFVLELFAMAKERHIPFSLTMMTCLVEAYCKNDRYSEAENLAIDITKEKKLQGDYVHMWNLLIRYNAKRRDLSAVNRLLTAMSQRNVTYNQDTYSGLLLTLLYCRQAHHALHLLQVARTTSGFEPTAHHYTLLVAAFMYSREPLMAQKILAMMKAMNFPQSAKLMATAISALSRFEDIPPAMRHRNDARGYLNRALNYFYQVLESEKKGSPDGRRDMINIYSKMTFVLTQMRRFTTIKDIISLHNARWPHQATLQKVPLRLLHDIMLADFHEENYHRLRETWNIILERTVRRGMSVMAQAGPLSPEDQKVMVAQKYRLCDPLKTMQRYYLESEDADGLINLVETVRSKGFELDSKNWNYYVQGLARLKRWRLAFLTCEERLMGQWLGWQTDRAANMEMWKLPVEVRRLASDPKRPRPIAHTLFILAKEYMDLEKITPWSNDALREFTYIQKSAPRVIQAITNIAAGHPLEQEIFGDDEQYRSRLKYVPPPPERQKRKLKPLKDGKGASVEDAVAKEKKLEAQKAALARQQAMIRRMAERIAAEQEAKKANALMDGKVADSEGDREQED
ncbi:hypothetical protein QBC40DRAFT_272098 [Triangularia verruculosa]|uniref:Uncharacterized protein n=1 Tax=Triangularia verruculosa TaxID=2587418 RepID=A0AAN6XQX7_9PEZI|nr:hypothetical protein QBC40DRAFT_272098 [Triangularia verruculosa]